MLMVHSMSSRPNTYKCDADDKLCDHKHYRYFKDGIPCWRFDTGQAIGICVDAIYCLIQEVRHCSGASKFVRSRSLASW